MSVAYNDYRFGSALAMRQEPIRQDLFFAIVPVLLMCTMSGQLLAFIGVNYINGSLAEKIHPATYLSLIFVFLQAAVFRTRDVSIVAKMLPGAVFLPVAAIALATYAGLFLDVPATGLPDTWVLTALVFFLCALLNTRERGVLRVSLDVFFVFNSLIGIYEVTTNSRLIPFTIAGAVEGVYTFPVEWRASGLIGHPLGASYVTGAYLLLLVLDGRVKNLLVRLPLIAFHLLALFCFGSRAAVALAGGTLALAAVYQFMSVMLSGRIQRDTLVYALSAILFGVVGAPLVMLSGFLDRFINRLSVDHGSANARSNVLDMLANVSWGDLMFGPPKLVTWELGKRFGVGDGIESFWLGYLFLYGIVGCVIFMPGLFSFIYNLGRYVGLHCAAVLLFFFGCCTTSVSLSSKSLTFAIVVALCMTSRHITGFDHLSAMLRRGAGTMSRRRFSPERRPIGAAE